MVSRKRAGEAVRAVAPPGSKARLLLFLDGLPDQELARWGIEEADDFETISGYIMLKAQASLPATAVPKTVDLLVVRFNPEEEEDEEVAYTTTFDDQESLEDFLRGAQVFGLVRVPEEEEEEEGVKPVLIRDIRLLEDGQLYRTVCFGQYAITGPWKRQTHLTQRQEDDASQAVLRDVQHEDPACVPDTSLRALKDSKGRDEVQHDGVIECESQQAAVLSHKTNCTGASMVEASATGAQVMTLKSPGAAYAGTRNVLFNGKKVVPAFMGEFTAATAGASLRRSGLEHGVRLYRRNSSSISPWASMAPLRRALARPAALR